MISLGLILAPMLVYVLCGLYLLSGGQLEKEDKVNKSFGVVTPRAIVVNAVAAAILHILPTIRIWLNLYNISIFSDFSHM
jgi:hypothetical protein